MTETFQWFSIGSAKFERLVERYCVEILLIDVLIENDRKKTSEILILRVIQTTLSYEQCQKKKDEKVKKQ